MREAIIKENLEEYGFKCAEKVSSPKHWLWIGAKPGNNKIADAKKHDAEISTPLDLMKRYLNATQPNKSVKPGF